MKGITIWGAALAAVACAGSVRAHHSATMFDFGRPIWIKGTVVDYQPVNPHVLFAIDVGSEDGEIQRWRVESTSLSGLARRGVPIDLLKAGDAIEVCGFALKDEARARVLAEYQRTYPAMYMHGHVLVMPDGTMRTWGSYGRLDNCVRPGDDAQKWLDFINNDVGAKQWWCRARGMVTLPSAGTQALFPSVGPQALLDEIDRRLTQPCR
jgi:hypothetical protein